MPGSRYDEARHRKVWFNSLAIMYSGIKDKLNDDPAKAVAFGDSEMLPPDKVHDLLKLLDEECVVLKWQKGDVLLVDNLAVLHARRPLLAPPASHTCFILQMKEYFKKGHHMCVMQCVCVLICNKMVTRIRPIHSFVFFSCIFRITL